MTDSVAEERGTIFWFPVYLVRAFGRLVLRNKLASLILGIVVLVVFSILRAYVQEYVVRARVLFPEIIASVVFLLLLYRLWRRGRKMVVMSLALVAFGTMYLIVSRGFEPHRFQILYRQYRTMDKVVLDQLPETRFERIHPLHSIQTASDKRIANVSHTTVPEYVKWGLGDPHWTVGVEPDYPYPRFFGTVNRIFALPGQSSTLDFSGEHQVEVKFDSGEGMHFTKNLWYLTRQGFGIWRYLSYEPADVKYIPGPDGKIVQCVSLIQWYGLFFPRPHFGGVVIFQQGECSFGQSLLRMFVGDGTWIKPGDIKNHSWLTGQNLVPYNVARNEANSFRFRYGYWSPLPRVHYNDLRIPDLPGDVNDQPFTMYFHFGEGDGRNKLYQYFALEPYQSDTRNKRGLAMSVLCPADGIGPVYYYEHQERNENCIGVSAVSTHVKEAMKSYDWSRNDVAEHRPYIRVVHGSLRLFWLSTVVTRTDENAKDFIAGSAIEVFLTDARTALPVQVKPAQPETWVQVLEGRIKL